MKRAKHFLSRPQVAERLGIKRATVGRYKLPEPDAYIGTLPGWLPKTIDDWDSARPSRQRKDDGGDTRPPPSGSA